MRDDLPTGAVVPVEALGASVDVHLPGLEHVLGHSFDPRRAVDRERIVASHDPRRKDEIRIADGVVGMQVGQEHSLDVYAAVSERSDAFLIGGCRAADHARTEVDEIGRVVDDDGGRRPGAVRIGTRRSSSEHDHASRSVRRR
jgi:hypothetical protein